MTLFEEVAEQRRLTRELGELFEENGEPVGLGELGWDGNHDHFRGRRVA
ncbi:hypothetical protein ACH427_21335 [Streptomyces sp. NPDC020379]